MSPWRRYRRWDPRRHVTHLRVRLGRRGTVLAALGALWLLMGAATVAVPGSTGYALLDVAPIPRGAAWILTGALAIVVAPRPQGHDAVGWVALYLMAGYRVLAYAVGFFDWLLVDYGGRGNPRGIIGALTWVAVLVILSVMAGWREPSQLHNQNDRGQRGR